MNYYFTYFNPNNNLIKFNVKSPKRGIAHINMLLPSVEYAEKYITVILVLRSTILQNFSRANMQ